MSNKKLKLEINPEIKEIFKRFNIPIQDGICYLLSLYYDMDPSYIPEGLKRKILTAGIIKIDYTSQSIVWEVDLFEQSQKDFEWIGEWMDLFKEINPERRGVKSDVVKRMKKFSLNNPFTSVEDIMDATKLYLKGVTEAKYCKKSSKFIYEIDGTSMLSEYLELLKKNKEAAKKDYDTNVI